MIYTFESVRVDQENQEDQGEEGVRTVSGTAHIAVAAVWILTV